MFGNIALDVFIGLVCIFLLYSLLASILMEAVAKHLGLRQRITLKAIFKLLDDCDYTTDNAMYRFYKSFDNNRYLHPFKDRPFTELFYAHPNIKNLGRNDLNRKPSSITPEMFAETLIQILRGDEFVGQQNQIDLIKSNLKIGVLNPNSEMPSISAPLYFNHTQYKHQKLKKKPKKNGESEVEISSGDQPHRININIHTYYQLRQMVYNSHSDIDWFRKSLITWFNEMMDRAEGWYIKQTRTILFVIGFVLAISFNVDTIAIAKKLATDKTARDKMIEFASRVSKDNPTLVNDSSTSSAMKEAFSKANANIQEARTIIGDLPSGIGLDNYFGLGWLITAFALSLGASFWFDLLGKIMCIRQGGNNSSTDAQKKVDKSLVNPTEEAVG